MKEAVLTSHHLSAILPLKPEAFSFSAETLLALLNQAVVGAGLARMADAVADFSPQGASAVIVLKESHVAVHIWPEHDAATVDIHVCDYMADNLAKARALAELLSQALSTGHDRALWQELTVSKQSREAAPLIGK